MELAAFVELIGTVGFPIVCVIALGWFVWHIYKQSVVREEKLLTEITENRIINEKFAEIIAGYEITLSDIKTDIRDIKDTLHITQENN